MSGNMRQTPFNTGGLRTPLNTPAQNGLGASRSQTAPSGPVDMCGSIVPDGGGNPSIPGTFEHIHDVATAGRQPHSDSWPKDTEAPPKVLERTRPPLGKLTLSIFTLKS